MPRARLLDGGTSTEISRLGFQIDDDPLWSSRLLRDNPGVIKQVHKSFLESGSEIIVTATYQASIDGFKRHLGVSEEEAKELIKRGVTIAKEACSEVTPVSGNTPLVGGSLGPYGAALHDGSEYTGSYIDNITTQMLMDWHRVQLKELVDSKVDIVAMETVPALKEAEALVELLKEFPSAKAWITFSCKDGEHVCHGERFSEAVKSVIHCDQVIATGINCTHPSYISSLLESIQDLKTDKDIIVKPNSGELWESGIGWHSRGPESPLIGYVQEWLDKGATWIGGCCRIYPNDIAKMQDVIRKN